MEEIILLNVKIKRRLMMKKFFVFFLVLALTGLVAMAKDTNVSGNWTLTITTQRGDMTSDVTFCPGWRAPESNNEESSRRSFR
jgi:hypothetical protein